MEQSVIIFFGGFFASFVGALTGGAGMFTVPMMIYAGLPPQVAVANNKLGAIGIFSGSLYSLKGQKFFPLHIQILVIITAVVGSYFGAMFLIDNDPQILKPLVGWIIAILLPLSVEKALTDVVLKG